MTIYSFFARALLPAAAMTTLLLATAPTQAAEPGHEAHHPQAAAAAPTQPGMTMPGMTGPGKPAMNCGMSRHGQAGSGAAPAGGCCAMMAGPGALDGSGMGGGRPGMMGMMGMMGGPGGMGMPFEHVEGRIAFLKAEIGITTTQDPVWTPFADAFRAATASHRELHTAMHAARAHPGTGPAAPGTSGYVERMVGQAKLATARAEALTALAAAAGPLFEALDPAQRQRAETLLSGPMGAM